VKLEQLVKLGLLALRVPLAPTVKLDQLEPQAPQVLPVLQVM
jgi:hypothetical protein